MNGVANVAIGGALGMAILLATAFAGHFWSTLYDGAQACLTLSTTPHTGAGE